MFTVSPIPITFTPALQAAKSFTHVHTLTAKVQGHAEVTQTAGEDHRRRRASLQSTFIHTNYNNPTNNNNPVKNNNQK